MDQRVWLIYVASFGLHPAGKEHPFEDVKSDMGTIELETFLPARSIAMGAAPRFLQYRRVQAGPAGPGRTEY